MFAVKEKKINDVRFHRFSLKSLHSHWPPDTLFLPKISSSWKLVCSLTVNRDWNDRRREGDGVNNKITWPTRLLNSNKRAHSWHSCSASYVISLPRNKHLFIYFIIIYCKFLRCQILFFACQKQKCCVTENYNCKSILCNKRDPGAVTSLFLFKHQGRNPVNPTSHTE